MQITLNAARRLFHRRYILKQNTTTKTLRDTLTPPPTVNTAHTLPATVTGNQDRKVAAVTTMITSSETPEEVAKALTLFARQECIMIITDSQTACHNCLSGRISTQALQIFRQLPERSFANIIWTPGHTGVYGATKRHMPRPEITYTRQLTPRRMKPLFPHPQRLLFSSPIQIFSPTTNYPTENSATPFTTLSTRGYHPPKTSNQHIPTEHPSTRHISPSAPLHSNTVHNYAPSFT